MLDFSAGLAVLGLQMTPALKELVELQMTVVAQVVLQSGAVTRVLGLQVALMDLLVLERLS